MTTNLTAWYDDVLPDLPGLSPGNAALKLIRDAVIEFCERSLAYEIDHPPVNIVATVGSYAFAPGTGLVVIEPKRVMVNGVSIDSATDEELDDDYGDDWRNGTLVAGPAAKYRRPDEANIQIVPTPDTSYTGGLVMRVAVAPAESVTTVDDRFRARKNWRDAITACAKYRAMLSQKKPYTNPQLATYWLNEFNRMVGGEDARATKGRTHRSLRSTNVHGIK